MGCPKLTPLPKSSITTSQATPKFPTWSARQTLTSLAHAVAAIPRSKHSTPRYKSSDALHDAVNNGCAVAPHGRTLKSREDTRRGDRAHGTLRGSRGRTFTIAPVSNKAECIDGYEARVPATIPVFAKPIAPRTGPTRSPGAAIRAIPAPAAPAAYGWPERICSTWRTGDHFERWSI